MPTWFIFTLISIVFLSIAEITYKRNLTSKQNISAETLNFLSGIVGLFFAIGYLIIFQVPIILNLNPANIILLIVVGIVYYESNKLFYSSYKGNSVSISYTLLSFSSVIAVILGVVFFKESITPDKVGGICSILIALFVVNYKKDEKFSKYNFLALGGAFIYGISLTLGKHFTTLMDPHLYQFVSTIGFLLATIIFSSKSLKIDVPKINFSFLRIIIITGLAFSIYNMLLFMSYSVDGEAGRIEAIGNTIVFIMIVYEVLFLKERKQLRRKLLGAILAILGVFLLSQI